MPILLHSHFASAAEVWFEYLVITLKHIAFDFSESFLLLFLNMLELPKTTKEKFKIADKCHANNVDFQKNLQGWVWSLLTIGGELLTCVGERQLSWRGAQMELSWRAQALPAACGSPELNSRELSWRAQLIGSQMIRAQLERLQHACLSTAQWAGHSIELN